MPVKKKAPKAKKVVTKARARSSAKPKPIGTVTHFYNKISVGIVKVKTPFQVGDTLKFVGKHGEFMQPITSMQYQHQPIEKAAKGHEVGIKVKEPVHEKDLVYLAK